MSFSLRRKKSKTPTVVSQPSSPVDSSPPSPPSPPQSSNSATSTTRQLGVPLPPVHESNRAPSPRRPPPSAFRAVPPPQSIRPGQKGKERDDSAPAQQRPGRAVWVCDSDESRRGAGIWHQSDRVILVIGEVSRAVLAPLLYSSAFADTLVLVGSVSPIPEIEALTSPSHLLNASDGRTIYPTVQPFVVPASALVTATPQAAILAQGSALAQAYRRGGGAETPGGIPRPGSISSRSRRGSTTSLRSNNGTPPSTPPPSRRRLMSFGRRSSDSPSESPRGSALDLAALSQSQSRPSSVLDYNGDERPNMRSRLSAYIRNDQATRDGSPFDAVINFIPSPPLNIDSQRALQEMLQYTVVLTSAAMPILMSAVTENSSASTLAITELAPLSLVHIVPVDAPPALAPVIERFLLPLLPTMGKRVRRDLFGVVTGLGAWLAPQADPVNIGLPGAETILFGGVRCPASNVTEEDRQQAMLAGWNHCLYAPGTLVEIEREEPAPVFSKRASALELSNIRPRGRHSREHSTSSVITMSSMSPPKSPQMGAASATSSVAPLPPGASFPLDSAPPQPRNMSTTYSPRMPPSLPQTSGMMPPSGSGSTRASQASTLPSSRSTPSSAADTQNGFTRDSEAFTSRFDPRYVDKRDNTVRPSTSDLSTLKSLPAGAAPVGEMGELPDMHFGMKKRSPSGLRNTMTLPQSLQPSPPTPELDTSGSSCSSSSVIEPNWAAEKAAPKPQSHGPKQMSSRKGFGFTSLFRRNGVRA